MDARGSTASSIVIRDDRISLVSNAAGIPSHSSCAKVVDLKGHRVVPGLVDTHVHFSYAVDRPGYAVRLDSASSIVDVQAAIRNRAAGLKAGDWITSVEGWSLAQLAEKRMPTMAELDAAAPDNPILLIALGVGGLGSQQPPASANSRAKTWLASKGVSVNDAGLVSGSALNAAYDALRTTMTFEDRKRSMADVLAYHAGMGVTTQIDNAGPWPPMPKIASVARTAPGGPSVLDPFTGYLPHLALDREGRLPGRVRILYSSLDLTPGVPYLRARLDNQMMGFGDDWLRVSGYGERVAGSEYDANGHATPPYEAAMRLLAERGWTVQQHASALEDEVWLTTLWEKINEKTPLAPLRWTMAHVQGIDRPTLDRLKAIGVGVNLRGWVYLNEGSQVIPPARTVVESGIHAGFGSDAPSPISPWRHIYSLVTGKNHAGKIITTDQTLSRMQALRLYTIDGAWFSFDEKKLGSIEAGKLADVAVLSEDFLDPNRVSDEAIKQLRSVLTVIGGRIVHDAGVLSAR